MTSPPGPYVSKAAWVWPAEDPGRRIAGTVDLGLNGIRATVLDPLLRPPRPTAAGPDEEGETTLAADFADLMFWPETMHAEVDGVGHITLGNCFRASTRLQVPPSVVMHGGYAVVGAHVLPDTRYYAVRVDIPHGAHWVAPVTPTAQGEVCRVVLEGGASCGVEWGTSTVVQIGSMESRVDFSFLVMVDEPMTLSEASSRYAVPFRHLVAFAFNRRGDHPLVSVRPDPTGSEDLPVVREADYRDKPVAPLDPIFTVDEPNLRRVIPAWFETYAELQVPLERVFRIVYDSDFPLAVRLQDALFALESIHEIRFPVADAERDAHSKRVRRLRDQVVDDPELAQLVDRFTPSATPSFLQRMQNLLEADGGALWSQAEQVAIARRLRDARNRLAHGGRLDPRDSSLRATFDEATALLRLIVMKSLGFGEDECRRVDDAHLR